jgi:hypothetical protein
MGGERWRVARAVVRNGLLWGAAWEMFALLVHVALRLSGHGPETLIESVFLISRFGFWGGVCGVTYALAVRLLYRGRQISGISPIRFALVTGLIVGISVPLLLQLLNILSGTGPIAWHLVTDDGLRMGILAALVAGVSLAVAKRQGRMLPVPRVEAINGASPPVPDVAEGQHGVRDALLSSITRPVV